MIVIKVVRCVCIYICSIHTSRREKKSYVIVTLLREQRLIAHDAYHSVKATRALVSILLLRTSIQQQEECLSFCKVGVNMIVNSGVRGDRLYTPRPCVMRGKYMSLIVLFGVEVRPVSLLAGLTGVKEMGRFCICITVVITCDNPRYCSQSHVLNGFFLNSAQ